MTDREQLVWAADQLGNILQLLRAHLATNVIPVQNNPGPVLQPPPGSPVDNLRTGSNLTYDLLMNQAANQVAGPPDGHIDHHDQSFNPDALNHYVTFASETGNTVEATYKARRTGPMKAHAGQSGEAKSMTATACSLSVTGEDGSHQPVMTWVPTGSDVGEFMVSENVVYRLAVSGNGSFAITLELEEV